jgi:methylated-DNA-[protein]-cysteine S-methyltransferase
VLAVICRIPPGRIASYGDVAKAAGRPRAARAVGTILSTCSAPAVPAHRVIAAQGHLGGFGGNLPLKRALLAAEGVIVRGNRVKDWRERRWTGGSSAGPRARNRPSTR